MRRGLLVAFLLAGAPPATAAIVVFEFTGEVFTVDPYFASMVEPGSPLAGRLSYDTSAADGNPDPTLGHYAGASLEFTLGSYSYAGDGSIYVYDDPGFDGFQFLGSLDGADPIDGLALAQADLGFAAGTGLYDSDALPAAPPALTDPALSEPPTVRVGVFPAGLGITYQSARLLSVPEPDGPAAALAAGAALAALARAARLRTTR